MGILAAEHVYKHFLMPKQHDFVGDDEAWEILYSGAFGAGKTRALCARAIRLAQYPGARVGLTRKTRSALTASTLITLLEPDGDLPAILAPGTYSQNKVEGRIRIHGGGDIFYFGCDDPLAVSSRPLTDICIDEAIELDEEEYEMLLGRRRSQYTKPDGTQNLCTLACVTNPGAPTHFLYKRFFGSDHAHRRVIETHTAENFHLRQDYLDSLSELTGPARDRYYLGKWVAYEGAIYLMFDPSIHVCECADTWSYYVAGVDVGFTNPNVIRLHGCDGLRSHVVWEFYETGIVSTEFVDVCRKVAEQCQGRPLVFVVDPSAADVIEQIQRAHLKVVPNQVRDVLSGIRIVQGALNDRLLTMSPDCDKGNREYQAYRWKDNVMREQPVKELDHALDADRYARCYIDQRGRQVDRIVPLAHRPSRREALRRM